jgi:hypothetical protein
MDRLPRGKDLGEPVVPVIDEAEHFMRCPECGGWIDCRDLGAVLEHDAPMPHSRHDHHYASIQPGERFSSETRCSAVPYFFFNISIGSEQFESVDGIELADLEAVQVTARKVIAEFVAKARAEGQDLIDNEALEVTDQNGDLVLRVLFRTATLN